MCTVTYVRNNSQAIITSSRDEHILRGALPPETYRIGEKNILFPKDPKAGGTWFATDEFGNVGVLLNGAFKTHVRAVTYRRSRGLIVLEIIASESPLEQWYDIDLDQVEPFTLILYTADGLFQLTWDGLQKYKQQQDAQTNHIWSSSTLYSAEIQVQRHDLFHDFLQRHTATAENLLDFHNTESSDSENGLIINRLETLKTLSITQAVIADKLTVVSHLNLASGQRTASALQHLQNKFL